MPKLNERQPPRVPTYLNLPATTRAELEAAIDHESIHTLTDAVIAAAKLLNKKARPRTAKETTR